MIHGLSRFIIAMYRHELLVSLIERHLLLMCSNTGDSMTVDSFNIAHTMLCFYLVCIEKFENSFLFYFHYTIYYYNYCYSYLEYLKNSNVSKK